jgi:hypothetical protein
MRAMLGGRSWESWIAEYSESHQHPLNRLTHTFGIPIIMMSLPVLVAGIVWHRLLWVGMGLFCFGWALQFIGHAIEGKPPEFRRIGGFCWSGRGGGRRRCAVKRSFFVWPKFSWFLQGFLRKVSAKRGVLMVKLW